MLDSTAQQNFESKMLVVPTMLGVEKTIELICARRETFFYRNMHKRLIDHHVINDLLAQD